MESGASKGLSWGRSPGYEQPGDREKYKVDRSIVAIAAFQVPFAGGGFGLAGALVGGLATRL